MCQPPCTIVACVATCAQCGRLPSLPCSGDARASDDVAPCVTAHDTIGTIHTDRSEDSGKRSEDNGKRSGDGGERSEDDGKRSEDGDGGAYDSRRSGLGGDVDEERSDGGKEMIKGSGQRSGYGGDIDRWRDEAAEESDGWSSDAPGSVLGLDEYIAGE